jgi:hypothetical protein
LTRIIDLTAKVAADITDETKAWFGIDLETGTPGTYKFSFANLRTLFASLASRKDGTHTSEITLVNGANTLDFTTYTKDAVRVYCPAAANPAQITIAGDASNTRDGIYLIGIRLDAGGSIQWMQDDLFPYDDQPQPIVSANHTIFPFVKIGSVWRAMVPNAL